MTVVAGGALLVAIGGAGLVAAANSNNSAVNAAANGVLNQLSDGAANAWVAAKAVNGWTIPVGDGPMEMAASGNHADSVIAHAYGEYAAKERRECKDPLNRCDWLDSVKGKYPLER